MSSYVDAGFGLGEALVFRLVNVDIYKVRNGKVIDKKISAKKLTVYALKDGGTKEQEIPLERQSRQRPGEYIRSEYEQRRFYQ